VQQGFHVTLRGKRLKKERLDHFLKKRAGLQGAKKNFLFYKM